MCACVCVGRSSGSLLSFLIMCIVFKYASLTDLSDINAKMTPTQRERYKPTYWVLVLISFFSILVRTRSEAPTADWRCAL